MKKPTKYDEVRWVMIRGRLTKAKLGHFTRNGQGMFAHGELGTALFFTNNDPEFVSELLLRRWKDLDDIVLRLNHVS